MADQKKTVVIFYSLEGSTAFVAKMIADVLGADVLELRLKKSLPTGFLKFVIGGMQTVFKHTPELLPFDKQPATYDRIFLGTPIWASNYTPAIRTFLKTTKFTGKKVALFCCCADKPGKAFDSLRQDLTGNTVIGEIAFPKVWEYKGTNEFNNKVSAWANEMATK